MSNLRETNFDLDLHFLPAWAQQPAATNQYADFKGEEPGREGRRGDWERRRGERRDRPPRREGFGDRSRPASAGPPGSRQRDRGFRDRRDEGRGPDPRASLPPLPEVDVAIVPEDKGVEALARQIRLTGRAYPLFDIGHLILKKPERYNVILSVIKKPDGQVAQSLFLCSLDESLWFSDQEAIDYVLKRHFDMFYRAERIPIDPPKGVFTFVAQCGMSGIILGPPNFHDYQNKLRKLHAERFAHVPFDIFKSRVKIVRDEAIVKQWKEEQSYTTEYLCLNIPEPQKLSGREAVEKHFRETHLSNVIQSVESHTLNGLAARSQPCPALQGLVRRAWEDQRRFPLKVVTALSQQFAGHGLQFFKVNKTVTHVSVARPHYLDLQNTSVSDNVKRIISFINANPNSTRRKLVEQLAPASVTEATTPPAPSSPPATEPTGESPAAAADMPSPEMAPQNPELTAIASDLHWLIHEGHVIEFANGVLDTAKPPLPRPPRAPKAAPGPGSSAPAADTAIAAPSEPILTPAESTIAEEGPPTEAPAADMADRVEGPSPAEPAAPATAFEAPPVSLDSAKTTETGSNFTAPA